MNNTQPDPDSSTMLHALLGGLSLLLAVTGQILLFTGPDRLTIGLIVSAAAVILFVASRWWRSPAWLSSAAKRRSFSRRVFFVIIAACLSLLTVTLAFSFDALRRVNYLPILFLWAMCAVIYFLAFADGDWHLDHWREKIKANRWEVIGLGAVTAGAAVIRFYRLGGIPRVINGDEGVLGLMALETIRLPLANPFALFENFGALYLQAIYYVMWLLGETPFALRLLPAIGGTLAIPVLYLLARKLFGTQTAFIAAILLAVSHVHIHFSRTVAVGYIQGTWLIPLELYFFISGVEYRSLRRLALGGLILGFHFSVYLSAQIITAFFVAYTLIAWVMCRPLIQNVWRKTFAFWVGVLLVALPNFTYAVLKPDEFLSRLNKEGTFQSGWLVLKMAESGKSAIQILIERVIHAFLSLIHYSALEFYGTSSPMVDAITGALFLFGVVYALWHARDHRYLLLNGYFWVTAVAVGIFSIPPEADSYRMLIAIPAVMLLAAIGFQQLLLASTALAKNPLVLRLGMSALLLVPIGVLNLRIYFMDFAARCRYGNDERTRFASYLGTYLDTLGRETRVFLLRDDLLFYGSHRSVDFLSGKLPVTNWTESVNTIKGTANMAIVAVPNRADELRTWAIDHPGGKFQREYDCDRLILLAYHIP
ncbi:MAG: glycosyltransferase family 39 protein [Chloroflexi bacterium]|nr:glycosyltransferase family 39 protein [Chloroflexota bacterium]